MAIFDEQIYRIICELQRAMGINRVINATIPMQYLHLVQERPVQEIWTGLFMY